MPLTPVQSNKKEALQAYKEKLLTEIYYYDKRIEESRISLAKSKSIKNYDSSDSDSDVSPLVESGQPISKLKNQQAMLKTCLQATQELTGLEVLQSEMNVLVEPPAFEGERPITEPGVWREVTADCCIGPVPFSITFFAHCSHKNFAPISYRGLKVSPVKPPHEAELSNSVLPGLRRPSDAVEVLRSYASAHRSRRTSLANLADKFGAALFLEPKSTGGYILKCGNLLVLSWTLQNQWSPIAPFYHRLKFDLEYMDESYLKIITQAHKQLSESFVDTEERTALLAKIISTCLEAAPLQPDSCEEEQPARAVDRRRTTLDREPDIPKMKRKKDSEVMAPPKSLPKKTKPKNKTSSSNDKTENQNNKRTVNEQNEISNENAKKPKIQENTEKKAEGNKKVKSRLSAENIRSDSTKQNKEETNIGEFKSDGDPATNENAINIDNGKKSMIAENSFAIPKKVGKIKAANKKKSSNIENDKNIDNDAKQNKNHFNTNEEGTKITTPKRKSMTSLKTTEKVTNAKVSRKCASNNHKNMVEDKNNEKNCNVKRATSAKRSDKDHKIADIVSGGKVIKVLKNINENGDVVKNIVKKLASDKPNVLEKTNVANQPKDNFSTKNTFTNKAKSLETVKKGGTNIAAKVVKPLHEQNNKVTKSVDQNNLKKVPKSLTRVPSLSGHSGIIKKMASGTIQKENTSNMKSTKIPQKKIGTPKRLIKKMPTRISPRKPTPKKKSPLAGVNKKKIIPKPVTGIPRLMPKSKPKVT